MAASGWMALLVKAAFVNENSATPLISLGVATCSKKPDLLVARIHRTLTTVGYGRLNLYPPTLLESRLERSGEPA